MKLCSVLALVNFGGSIGIGFLILYQNPRLLSNRIFSLAIFNIGILEFSNFMLLNSSNPSSLLFWGRISLLGCSFIPPNWYFFSLIFAKTNYSELFKRGVRAWKIIIAIIYLLSICFLFFIPYDSFIALPSFVFMEELANFYPNNYNFLIGKIGRFFLFFLLLVIIFILSNLETIYRESAGIKKWQIKYSIIGMFTAFLFSIYIVSRSILFASIQLRYLPINSLVIFFSSLPLVYSLFKHKLMDINLHISRQMFYGSFTIVIISSYLILVGFIGELVKILQIDFDFLFYSIFVLISFVALASFFLLSEKNRKKFRKFIEKNFYGNKYDYRYEWTELTNRISYVVDMDDLLKKFNHHVCETMCVDEVLIWLYNSDYEKFQLASSLNNADHSIMIEKNNSLIKFLESSIEPFSLPLVTNKSDSEKADFYIDNKAFIDKYNIVTFCSLRNKDEFIGFITLGKEMTGAFYSNEDYDVLKTMCHQAASVIMNIQLLDRLALAKEIDLMNRLSSFVLHDLKNSVSMLSLIVQNATLYMDQPEFQKDAMETVAKTVEKMKVLMAKMASMPNEIDLNFSEIDLNEIIQEIVKGVKLWGGNLTVKEQYTPLPKVKLDRDRIKSVLYNLLVNAQEAIDRERKPNAFISISTSLHQPSSLLITVQDNGQGMSKEFLDKKLFKPFQTTKKKGLGIGLYQCKTIVTAHGGSIEVASEVGKGTTFSICLPIQ